MSLSDTSKHPCFYIDTVTFRVEDCLFKVPREPFETESVVFGDMFCLPKGDLQNEEGKHDDVPIHLHEIDKNEFEDLLSVLFYRTHGSKCQKPLPETNAQWTSILKLAILWGFDTIREAALRRLRRLSAVDRVRLGEDFDLDFESWLLPAMHEIVRRHEPLSVEEAQRLGLETTLKLASARECVSPDRFSSQVIRRPSVEHVDYSQLLRKIFQHSSD